MPSAINERLEDLLHLAADFKDQIPAVFNLIGRLAAGQLVWALDNKTKRGSIPA